MRKQFPSIPTILALLIACTSQAEQTDDFYYFEANRLMIRNGVQAVLTCNGLFTSERSLEQVFEQELAYLSERVGTVEGGDYRIDRQLKAVAIGGNESGPVMRAAFRDGIGCVIMAPLKNRPQCAQVLQVRQATPQPWASVKMLREFQEVA